MESKKKTKWPLYLTLVIAVYMLSMISWAIFSFTQKVDLVEKDYYQKGVAYSEQIDRIKSSQNLPEQPTVQIDKERDLLVLSFPASFDRNKVKGLIMFYRPSDSSLDWTTPLMFDANHQQVFPASKLVDGFWKIKLNWSDGIREFYHEQSLTVAREK
ncbi:MAG: FixH family protein [Deferribacteres bacterium]|nr:FixH family protein [candidate division KSB1 bacterium]MCB9502328.1 FixH family protein [Deferribacteres bacterium]